MNFERVKQSFKLTIREILINSVRKNSVVIRAGTTSKRLALVSICEIDVTSFSKMEEVLNGYVTKPNPTPTLTPNPNRNPNSNPNQINKKNQKETTLKTDQMT